jgi:putative component of membrane protein insertase Oxa1/YidC/SpoIIIJ protein YidD
MLDVAVDAADVAVAFVAVAVNVYAVFDCNPVIVTGDDPVPVNDPGFEVIV